MEGAGESEGDEGPGVLCSAETGAEGPYEFTLGGVDASSTSFKRDCRKLGSLEASALIRADA